VTIEETILATYGTFTSAVLTAAELNTIGLAWTAYTPTLTNVTTGTASGRYMAIGKTLHFTVRITAGTATAANVVTLSLPSGMTSVAGFVQILAATGPANVGTLAYCTASSTAVTVHKGAATINWTAADSVASLNVTGVIELA
jgi:hypothetical protein